MHFTLHLNRSKKQYAKKNYAHAGGQPMKNFSHLELVSNHS